MGGAKETQTKCLQIASVLMYRFDGKQEDYQTDVPLAMPVPFFIKIGAVTFL